MRPLVEQRIDIRCNCEGIARPHAGGVPQLPATISMYLLSGLKPSSSVYVRAAGYATAQMAAFSVCSLGAQQTCFARQAECVTHNGRQRAHDTRCNCTVRAIHSAQLLRRPGMLQRTGCACARNSASSSGNLRNMSTLPSRATQRLSRCLFLVPARTEQSACLLAGVTCRQRVHRQKLENQKIKQQSGAKLRTRWYL